MAIIFSPLANEEMTGAFKPLPGCAFIMIHSAAKIAPVELEIERRVNAALRRNGFRTTKATRSFGTKDYLDKIVRLIRGCGFGIAIFSEHTPAKTLANIFFEIGICYVLGKDVIIVKTQDAQIPTDFVRNEWIEFRPTAVRTFNRSLERACATLRRNATFYTKLGELSLSKEGADFELAFERLKQAALLVRTDPARRGIGNIRRQLAELSRRSDSARARFSRLKSEVDHFVKLYPRNRSRR